MNLSEYQKLARRFARYPGLGTLSGLGYLMLGLTSEACETAGEVKKAMRDDDGDITPERRSKILEEAGDALWYLAMIAAELGADLTGVAQHNLNKLEIRRLGLEGVDQKKEEVN
jgi:NTP pyrophosphatase (non-canonical NTP hydrolase)